MPSQRELEILARQESAINAVGRFRDREIASFVLNVTLPGSLRAANSHDRSQPPRPIGHQSSEYRRRFPGRFA